MHFRRIAVRNFRKLEDPVVIEGLSDGICIIAGDNEEGKSTLLKAVRAGLFERHNLTGRGLEAMQPFGSNVRPEVRLDFEIDGRAFVVTKRFGLQNFIRLETPEGNFDGPAAEDKISDLLKFRVAKKGASKAEDHGVLGFFWLEQGRAADGLAVGDVGRTTLRSALEEEVGDVLGGPSGRKLLDAARAKRGALLTATGKPTGELAAAISAVDSADELVRELQEERRKFDGDLDELARCRREISRIDSDQELERAEEALKAAGAAAAKSEAVKRLDADADKTLAVAQANNETAAERWKQRAELIGKVEEAERKLESQRRVLAGLMDGAEAVQSQVQAAKTAWDNAAKSLREAKWRAGQAQNKIRENELRRNLKDMDESLSKISQFIEERDEASRILTSSRIDQKSFEALRQAEQSLREKRAALGVVATMVRFHPEAGRGIARARGEDGAEAVAPEMDVLLTDVARFALEGFGEISISPGGADLSERRSDLLRAETELENSLEAVGAVSVSAAKAALDVRDSAQRDFDVAGRMIGVHAPEGVEALKLKRQKIAIEISSLEALLADEPTQDVRAQDVWAEDLQTAENALARAEALEEERRRAFQAAERKSAEFKLQVELANQALEQAQAVREAEARTLERAVRELSDEALYSALSKARGALEAASLAKRHSKMLVAEARPEEIALRRRQAEAALESIKEDRQNLSKKAFELETRFNALGQSGLGERLEEACGALERRRARLERLERDARAWDLLVRELAAAERGAKEAFLRPVLERVEPFLQLLMPGAKVALDEETLEITGIKRGAHHEPFESLSVGAREQLSILVRLAFAVYLQEKGVPSVVILDDALVYADDDRFDRMLLALRKTAETVQVIILTCRARDWRPLGASIRRLADGKSGSFELDQG